MSEIQILSEIDSYDGVAQSGKNKGQPYTKKTLSIMYKGNATEVSAFVDPDKDYHFNVGEFYEGNVVKYRDKLTFKPTDKIIKSDEPAPPTDIRLPIPESKTKQELPPKAGDTRFTEPPPPKTMSEAITKAFTEEERIRAMKAYTQRGTIPDDAKEAKYVLPESAKEKSMRKMNILNNAVAKLCATIKISKPVGGDGTKQVIAFGDAHFNIDDLLKKFIEEFKDYYEKN